MSIPLVQIVASSVETAFGLVSQIVGLGTFYKNPDGGSTSDYDPVEDTSSFPTPFENVRMMKLAVDVMELAGTIVTVQDVKILIPAVDMPGITPENTDYIFLQGVTYNITRVKPVPTNALHIVFCRAR